MPHDIPEFGSVPRFSEQLSSSKPLEKISGAGIVEHHTIIKDRDPFRSLFSDDQTTEPIRERDVFARLPHVDEHGQLCDCESDPSPAKPKTPEEEAELIRAGIREMQRRKSEAEELAKIPPFGSVRRFSSI